MTERHDEATSKIQQDAPLNRQLLHDRPGRTFFSNDDTRWGELILPAAHENPQKTEQGLRVLLIASMPLGYAAVRTVTEYERRNSDRLNLVALVTDDPINPDAKIGIKKRFWKYFEPEERLRIETASVEAALMSGVPVYTGEVKIDWFRAQADKWRPDAIIVCAFGQVIDRNLIDLPPYGIYNCHPSDLAHDLGAGLAPYENLYERDAATTVWTVHHVAEEVDAGHIVGWSPPVSVRTAADTLPRKVKLINEKMLYPLSYMVYFLIDTLTKKYLAEKPGAVQKIDFESRFPDGVKARLMEPISGDGIFRPDFEPDPEMFDLGDSNG